MNLRYLLFFGIIMLIITACAVTRKNSKESPVVTQLEDDHLIKDQFIVQLKGQVEPETVVAAYHKYGLTIKKTINRRMNLWVFNYDRSSLKPEKMLDLLKNSEFVSQAEFDKRVQTRQNN